MSYRTRSANVVVVSPLEIIRAKAQLQTKFGAMRLLRIVIGC